MPHTGAGWGGDLETHLEWARNKLGMDFKTCRFRLKRGTKKPHPPGGFHHELCPSNDRKHRLWDKAFIDKNTWNEAENSSNSDGKPTLSLGTDTHLNPARVFRGCASSCCAFRQDKSAADCDMFSQSIHVADWRHCNNGRQWFSILYSLLQLRKAGAAGALVRLQEVHSWLFHSIDINPKSPGRHVT